MDSTSVDAPVPDYAATLDTPPETLRIGLVREYFGEGLDPEIEAAIREAVRVYEAAGATIKEVSLPHAKYGIPAYYIVAPAECSSNLARYDGTIYGHRAEDFSPCYPGEEDLPPMIRMMMASRAEGFGAEVKRRIMLGTFALSAGYADQYYNQALKVRRLIRDDFDAAFKEVDVLLGPTSPTAAFKIGERIERPAGDVPLRHLHHHRQPGRHPRPERPLRPDEIGPADRHAAPGPRLRRGEPAPDRPRLRAGHRLAHAAAGDRIMPVRFTTFGATLADLQAASPDRLAEANELLGQCRHGSAIALGLYALEIYLKVRICLRLDLDALPTAFQTHELDGLLVLSGLKRRMDHLGIHPVKANWDVLSSPSMRSQHVNDCRYKANASWTPTRAADVLSKIQDSNDGVLTWLLTQP